MGAVLRSLDVNVGSAVGSTVTVLNSTVLDRLVISGELRGNANVTIVGCKVSGPAEVNISSPNCSGSNGNVCFLTIARNTFSDASANASELLRINSAAISAGVHAAIVGNILSVGHDSGLGLRFAPFLNGAPMGSSTAGEEGRNGSAIFLVAFNFIIAPPSGAALALLDFGLVGPMREFVVWGSTVMGGAGAGVSARFSADADRLVIVGNSAPSFSSVDAYEYVSPFPTTPSDTQEGPERHVGCNALSSGGYAHFSGEDFGAKGVHVRRCC